MLNTVKYVMIFYRSSAIKLTSEYEFENPNMTVSVTAGCHEHEICFFRSKLLRSGFVEIKPFDFKPKKAITFTCHLTGETATLQPGIYYEKYECLHQNGNIQEFIIIP